MVINVDTWIETTDGIVGIVTDVSEMRRAGGSVTIHVLGEDEPVTVDVADIKQEFR